MKCAGIIVEWNPLHRGHLIPMEAARKNGATHLVAVMSGNYVQRGEPALCPWPYRVRAALQSGCDLVVQLPLPYATATAERFAAGGTALLQALGCVDTLVFGCEAGAEAPLLQLTELLDSPAFPPALAQELEHGAGFAAARQRAVATLAGEQTAALLEAPNNILATEYLLALRKMQSTIAPLAVPRVGAAHDGEAAVGGLAPASLLRQLLRQGENIDAYLPPDMAAELSLARAEGRLPEPALWERPLMTVLRGMSAADFAALPDVSEGLENRLYRASRTATTTEELLAEVKTRRYSHARLRRILLAAFLGTPAELCRMAPPYLRILGMNARGAEILAEAKGKCTLPLSASLAELTRTGEAAARFAAAEARATDRYNTIIPAIHPCDEEYTLPLIKG